MLLMGAKGASTAAGGGVVAVAVGIASLFSGGGDNANGNNGEAPPEENGTAQVEEQPNDEGNGEDPFEPASTELDNGMVNGEEHDVLFAPKTEAEDLLAALHALQEFEAPSYDQASAVFSGDVMRVELLSPRAWNNHRLRLKELAESGRSLREGANPTDLGPLHLERTEQGEWRIVLGQ